MVQYLRSGDAAQSFLRPSGGMPGTRAARVHGRAAPAPGEAREGTPGPAPLSRMNARRQSLGGQHHEAVDPDADLPRLVLQFDRVVGVLEDKDWHTLHEIAEKTASPEGSVGSQIRNARVEGYVIEKRRREPGRGTWEYRWTGEKQGDRALRFFAE
jgi:hypothetical protein